MKGGKDKFMSLFCYDESVKEYVKEKEMIDPEDKYDEYDWFPDQ